MSGLSIEPFSRAMEGRHERLAQSAREGTRVIGYLCAYTPVEIIHAAGFTPVRVLGSGTGAAADGLTPGFVCPYVRGVVQSARTGELSYLSGMIQGYTCDAACGVLNVLREYQRESLFHIIPIPYNNSPESRRFFQEALGETIRLLDTWGGSFTTEALERSSDLYRRIRSAVAELYQARYAGTAGLSARDFFTVIQAGFVMPPEEYLPLVEDLLAALPSAPASPAPRAPVLVSGSLIEDPAILDILEASGATVVGDDLCAGFRSFHPVSGQGAGPMERLMDRYLNRFPCPARSRAEDRMELVDDVLSRSGARCVVCVFQKFCTPHLSDYPALRRMLEDRGIPTTLVEIEESVLGSGQLQTRFEAFVEMIT